MPFTFDSDTPFETRRLDPLTGEPLYRNGGHGQPPAPGAIRRLHQTGVSYSLRPVIAEYGRRVMESARRAATTPPADLVRVEARSCTPYALGHLADAQQHGRSAVYFATRRQGLYDHREARRQAAFAASCLRLAAPSLFQPADAAGEG